jgi:acyl carrier protein
METAMSEAPSARGADRAERLREFILERFPLARKAGLDGSTALLEGGIVDSLGILELGNFIEEAVAIVIVDEELIPENFNSIDSLVAFIAGKESGS